MIPVEQNSGFGMSQAVEDATAPADGLVAPTSEEIELVEIEAPVAPVATETFVEDVPELVEPEPALEPEIEVRLSPKEKRAARKAREMTAREAGAPVVDPALEPGSPTVEPVAVGDTPTVVITPTGNSEPPALPPRTIKEMERGAAVVAAKQKK